MAPVIASKSKISVFKHSEPSQRKPTNKLLGNFLGSFLIYGYVSEKRSHFVGMASRADSLTDHPILETTVELINLIDGI